MGSASDYSPSSWGQRWIIAIAALIAMSISLYLGLYQWKIIPFVWDPLFGEGTQDVLDSPLSHRFSSWIHIPDAILGALVYFSDLVFALAGSARRWRDHPWLVILFGIDVIPVGLVSFTLVVLQGSIVKHWCFLCLIAACISLLLVILARKEVLASCFYLREVKKRSDWKTF